MPLATCPSRSDLEHAYRKGLPEDEMAALERHVQHCQPCMEKLIAVLSAHDTLVDAIKGQVTLISAITDPLVVELIHKLEDIKLLMGPQKNSEVRMLTIHCSACPKKLSVKEELAGKKVKCPGCGTLTMVPALRESNTGSPPPP